MLESLGLLRVTPISPLVHQAGLGFFLSLPGGKKRSHRTQCGGKTLWKYFLLGTGMAQWVQVPTKSAGLNSVPETDTEEGKNRLLHSPLTSTSALWCTCPYTCTRTHKQMFRTLNIRKECPPFLSMARSFCLLFGDRVSGSMCGLALSLLCN